uniref:(California timema) hypothetical protein n=1 Tax=Timema californicum TaxID=61474 RepID=A0A7R9PB60_TIMCA|nr:unnamed protein product [Timema californicum]
MTTGAKSQGPDWYRKEYLPPGGKVNYIFPSYKFIREVKSHDNDLVLKQQISPVADNLAWHNCQDRCSESGNIRTAIFSLFLNPLQPLGGEATSIIQLPCSTKPFLYYPSPPFIFLLSLPYSSPMASLVLTDSSKLTFDSQHLVHRSEIRALNSPPSAVYLRVPQPYARGHHGAQKAFCICLPLFDHNYKADKQPAQSEPRIQLNIFSMGQ